MRGEFTNLSFCVGYYCLLCLKQYRWSYFWSKKTYGHISMKVPNVKFNFDVRSKSIVEIKMMSPYHSVQMSTQHHIWLWCMCWQQTVPNRCIKIKFNVGYFQWYMPMIQKTAELDEQNFVLIQIEHWLVFDPFFIGTEICRTKTFSSSRLSKRKTCFHLEFLKLELIDQIFFFTEYFA